MERVILGQHGYVHIINEPDADGVNQNCQTGYPKYTLKDPSGVVTLDAVAMENPATGEYTYQPAVTGIKGSWNWSVELRTNDKISFQKGTFEVL